MKIFRHTAALLLSVIGLSAWASDFTYTISGTLPDSDGRKAYLMLNDNNQIIDSAEISGGRFTMRGRASDCVWARVDVADDYALLIMSPEPVEIDFATHSPLTGDSVNMANRRFQIHSDALARVFRDLLMRYTREKDKDYAKEKLQPFLNYYLDYMKETIRLNSENAVSEAALRCFAMQATPEQWKELYPLLSPRLQGLRFTHMWDEKMSAAMKMSPGCMFADIEGKTADGAPSRLSDFIGHGRYVLVDFWASWCGPCRAEGRDTLVPLYEKYGGDERFEILGVATWDEHNRTLKAVEEEGYKWPQLFDAGMTPMDVYGFDGIPMIMLFAPDGTMMARGIRGAEIWKAVDDALK